MQKRKQLLDLRKRFFVSSIVILLVASLIWFSTNPIMGWVVVGFVALMAAAGVWEYANLAKSKGLSFSSYLMILVAVCQIVSFYLVITWIDWPDLPIVVLALGAGLFFITHFRELEDALVHIAVEFFGV